MTDVCAIEKVEFPDGSRIEMRQIGIRDGRLVSQFLSHLSAESSYKRFLSLGGGGRSEWVSSLVTADQRDFLAYGAFARDRFGSGLVAVAESVRRSDLPDTAEFAIAAVDPWQGLGIGTLLAGHLARVAAGTGVRRWESYMLADNRAVARVLANVARRVDFSVDTGLATATYELPLAG